jgi:CheY-like chemotaxis protein
MSGRRVLVADDLAPVLSAVGALLRESFEIVGMASDGQSALESTMKQEPHLVVLDMSMPGMSGIEVARELKRRAIMPRSYSSPFMRTRIFWGLLLQPGD